MAWDDRKLAIEVVEQFATANAWSSYDAIMIEAKLLSSRRAADAARQQEARNGRLALGLCARCEGKLDPNSVRHCTKHREQNRDEARKRRMREKLPVDRQGITQKFTILTRKEVGEEGVQEVDIYLIANTYPDGRLGEVFIHIGKAGHTEAIYDEWAKSVSRSLQYQMPVDELFRQHVGTRFDPHGATLNKDFPRCTSVLDLVSRWILSRYGSAEAKNWIASMQHKEVQP